MTNRKRVYSVKNHIISNSFVQSVKIIETLLFAQNPQSQVKLRTAGVTAEYEVYISSYYSI